MRTLSHSSMSMYMNCPRSYQIHYEEGLCEERPKASLLFGSVMDKALNELLEYYDFARAYSIMEEGLANKEFTNAFFTKTEDSLDALNSIGREMLTNYYKYVLPQFTGIVDQQKMIEKEIDGFKVVGTLDLVAILDKDPIIFDHKTSSMPYKKDAIDTSAQLALYSILTDIEEVGYIVMYKRHIRIKNVDVLTGTIPKQFVTNVRSNISRIGKLIMSGIFPMNFDKCNNLYGAPCPYKNYCHKGSRHGLITKEAK